MSVGESMPKLQVRIADVHVRVSALPAPQIAIPPTRQQGVLT